MSNTEQESVFGERDALGELLVAALNLCLQIRELGAADHVLDALRELHANDNDGGNVEEAGRAGFQ